MSLFDRFRHGYDVTKWKADQLVRINRVKSEIDALRRQVSEMRVQIAGVTLELHQKGTLANEELQELCLKIDGIYHQISEKEAHISAIQAEEAPLAPEAYYQPVNPCPNCNYDVPPGATFCTNCGNPMPVNIEPTESNSDLGMVTCSNCGTHLAEGTRFCTKCGNKIEGNE